jgi:hypothetical protein
MSRILGFKNKSSKLSLPSATLNLQSLLSTYIRDRNSLRLDCGDHAQVRKCHEPMHQLRGYPFLFIKVSLVGVSGLNAHLALR